MDSTSRQTDNLRSELAISSECDPNHPSAVFASRVLACLANRDAITLEQISERVGESMAEAVSARLANRVKSAKSAPKND